MVQDTKKRRFTWRTLIPWLGIIISLPFFIGGCAISYKECHLPTQIKMFAIPLLLEAKFFSIGFAISLLSTLVGLNSKKEHIRLVCTGFTMLGVAIIISGYIMKLAIENSYWNMKPSILPFMIPGILYVYSFWLLIISAKTRSQKPDNDNDKKPSEEQLQPLSRS